jgi:hypothetical protein
MKSLYAQCGVGNQLSISVWKDLEELVIDYMFGRGGCWARCSPSGGPLTLCVDQADLELTDICLFLPGIKGVFHQAWL